MPTLRLLSYNVRSLRDDPAAVSRVIRAAQPDVVCIQEAPRFLRWRSKCAALARRSGLVVVNGGRAAGANLLLSTLAVDVIETREVLFAKNPRLHQRGSAMAVLSLRGSRFAVAGTHLDPQNEPRLGHLTELRKALDELAGPDLVQLVAGDFNEQAGDPGWSLMLERSIDAWAARGEGAGLTSNALAPDKRIDVVFVDPRVEIGAVTVLDGPDVLVASDHRPLLVELTLP